MFWKIADELYTLAKKALQETNHHIQFEINERAIHVWIEENGRTNNTRFDGIYDIYNKDTLSERSLNGYEAARAHLECLLKEHT